jgi:hypothetical protein
MLAPRQVMSRHFHSTYELFWYSSIEYTQRQQSFVPLGELFWKSFRDINTYQTMNQMMMMTSIDFEIRGGGVIDSDSFVVDDKAGPIIDSCLLYRAFRPANTKQKQNNHNDDDDSSAQQEKELLPCGVFTSVYDLPRKHLVQLALSVGIGQQFPLWFGRILVQYLTPSIILRSQVNRLSEIVCHDDALLLEEGHHCNHCEFLTDEEVTDACLIRGLPVDMDDSANIRRQCLTDHLNMIAEVKLSMNGPMDSGFRLFTIHLAPLRHHMMMMMTKTTHGKGGGV